MKADTKNISTRLRRVRGQIDGIIKMVEDDRYCIDISNQLLAASKALDAINNEVLTSHLRSCVKASLENKVDSDEKIEEFISIIRKIQKI